MTGKTCETQGKTEAGDVITVVFGATSGCTVQRWKNGGCENLLQANIPWVTKVSGDDEAVYWPNPWIKDTLGLLRHMANPGDIIAAGMPGADLALLLNTGGAEMYVPPVQHYRSVPDCLQDRIEASGKLALYLRQNGANVASFQPPAQLLAESLRRPTVLGSVRAIVPFCDVLTAWLVKAFGGQNNLRHDPTMIQSQGLSQLAAMREFMVEQIPGFAVVQDKLTPWPMFDAGKIIQTPSGVMIVPVTQDSVPSRMVGFASAPNNVWTGTWVGTASMAGPDCQPSAESFAAGLAFEGVDASRAVISNCGGMAGTAYKALKGKLSYAEAAAAALPMLQGLKIPDPSAIRECGVIGSPDFAEKWHNLYRTRQEDLASFLKYIAGLCVQKLAATDKLFGRRRQRQVAVTGGWAENDAFNKALELLDCEVIIPPFADKATAAGLAAEALVRAGRAKDFAEALAILQGE